MPTPGPAHAGRLIAIGDIHGCSAALDAVVAAVDSRPDDTLVFLGDYVDRGPDSRGVLDRLIALADRCRVVPILGNHDEMMLAARDDPAALRGWLTMGGDATLESYADIHPDDIPADHFEWLAACPDFHETTAHFFVHGSYRPDRKLADQHWPEVRWLGLRDHVPAPHRSGKTAIVGHTSQKDGVILDLGHVVCIDTYCYGGGWLTALDVESGQTWQARRDGSLNPDPPRLAPR